MRAKGLAGLSPPPLDMCIAKRPAKKAGLLVNTVSGVSFSQMTTSLPNLHFLLSTWSVLMRQVVAPLAALLLLAGCSSLNTAASSKLAKLNGTPVSADVATKYSDLPTFIRANLDNTTPSLQSLTHDQKPEDPVLWRAYVSGAASDMKYAKKPKADLERFCQVKGGHFEVSKRDPRTFSIPEPSSPLMTGLMAGAFARSMGTSEAIARQSFSNAYSQASADQMHTPGVSDSEAVTIANKIIADGFVGVFSCRNSVPEKSWSSAVYLDGFQPKSNVLDAHTFFIRIYPINSL